MSQRINKKVWVAVGVSGEGALITAAKPETFRASVRPEVPLRVISGCADRSAAWQVNLIKRTRRTRARRFSDPPPTGCQRVRRARFNFRTRCEANKLLADRAVSAE